MVIRRFDVCLVSLDPTCGHEIKKTRPCLVISPDEMNDALRTVIVAPMTTKSRACPTRVRCKFQDTEGYIVLDQIRTVDRIRFAKRLGRIAPSVQRDVLIALAELFGE